MGRAERSKGGRGEREVEGVFRSHGLALLHLAHTGDRYCPVALDGFVGFHVESKRQETLRVPLWLRQAHDDAAKVAVPLVPVVAFRCNRTTPRDPLGRWNAVLPLDPLAALIASHGGFHAD